MIKESAEFLIKVPVAILLVIQESAECLVIQESAECLVIQESAECQVIQESAEFLIGVSAGAQVIQASGVVRESAEFLIGVSAGAQEIKVMMVVLVIRVLLRRAIRVCVEFLVIRVSAVATAPAVLTVKKAYVVIKAAVDLAGGGAHRDPAAKKDLRVKNLIFKRLWIV